MSVLMNYTFAMGSQFAVMEDDIHNCPMKYNERTSQ